MAVACAGLGSAPLPAAAQPASGITSPATGSSISNDVAVRGTAVIEPFQKYELYFKREPSGDDAYIWFDGGTTPVVDGQLGVWAASGLEPGVYSLRLRVVKNDGNYGEYFARNISVNQGPPPTDTPDEPTETPIPTATFTPAPQPTPAVGQVTQPQVTDPPTVAAIAASSAPTNTPTPAGVAIADTGASADPASNADSSVIVNPDNAAAGAAAVEAENSSMTRQLGEALSVERLRTHFFNGMRYSAALFLVIGLIFLGKRILVWVRAQV